MAIAHSTDPSDSTDPRAGIDPQAGIDPPDSIDPRAFDDPRNHYPTDEQFYASDRPARPVLPEDRPRGGGPATSLRHRGPWATVAFVAGIVLLVLVGIALFP